MVPMYNGLLIDQSMALNRKRDDQKDVKTEVEYHIFKYWQVSLYIQEHIINDNMFFILIGPCGN